MFLSVYAYDIHNGKFWSFKNDNEYVDVVKLRIYLAVNETYFWKQSIFYLKSFDTNNPNEIYAPLGLHMDIRDFNNAIDNVNK